MVNGALIFLVLITFTFGAPINHPVNNAYANLHTADLFRITQISNNFTVIDYQSPNQIYVFMDYKEKINKDLLFCPRTFDNPFMGYFGRNTKREHVMCKEILYETTFKCVVTNLRAECKSLQSFDSILTKTTTLKTKAEDSEQNTKTP